MLFNPTPATQRMTMSTQLTLDYQAFSILITTYYAHSPLLPTFLSTYLTHSSVDDVPTNNTTTYTTVSPQSTSLTNGNTPQTCLIS
jgi:hypothetical protein